MAKFLDSLRAAFGERPRARTVAFLAGTVFLLVATSIEVTGTAYVPTIWYFPNYVRGLPARFMAGCWAAAAAAIFFYATADKNQPRYPRLVWWRDVCLVAAAFCLVVATVIVVFNPDAYRAM